MDSIDLNIIELLKKNSRMTSSEISKKVNLSIPAVAERIRKMEEARLIEKYTVKLDKYKFNYKLTAFLLVNIDKTEHIHGFREAVVKFKHVLECHHVAGEYDYLIKVVVQDTKELEDFISNSLKKVDGVQKSNTIIVLSTLKEEMNA